ncbi:MAG: hypothetical protein ACEQSQ_10290 [Candidatus Paceibacteria bacterium]
MFKKSIYAITVLSLFTACSQKDLSVNSYDLATYWFNVKSLNDNKVILNKNVTEQYNDGHKTSSYVDFNVYKKNKTDLNQIEKYSFFEDINKENYKLMISNKSVNLKYNIFVNEIKENFEVDSKQISSYKRNIKINDNIIEDKDIDGNELVCSFSNYYENINIKDKINVYFKSKYFTKDKNYNNVVEVLCKDSFIKDEYYIFMAKDIGTILFMGKDEEDGSLVETYSILDTQTILD